MNNKLLIVVAIIAISAAAGYYFVYDNGQGGADDVVPPPPPGNLAECKPTGCSGQICSDEDVITTCEYREEYACYQTAVCERQTSGECGWTETEELKTCLGGAR